MKLDIFGRVTLEITKYDGSWVVYECGNEGKKRKTKGINIPQTIKEDEIVGYVEDFYHEWATPDNHAIKVIS